MLLSSGELAKSLMLSGPFGSVIELLAILVGQAQAVQGVALCDADLEVVEGDGSQRSRCRG